MRNLVLSLVLVAVPIAAFAGVHAFVMPGSTSSAPATATAPALGDMSPFIAITTDVQALAAQGDLPAAGQRITDLETAWDDAQKSLRPNDPAEWGNVDGAIDAALTALRTTPPGASDVKTALEGLQTSLADPSAAAAGAGATSGAPDTLGGIATTDANGRPLPCEVMLDSLRARIAEAKPSGEQLTAVASFRDKGTERCNADDDKRADDFFAQGLALLAR